MNISFLHELAKEENPVFSKVKTEEIKHVPFYGDMYHYTYGQTKAVVNPIVDLLRLEGLTKNAKLLEVFAGVAFESAFLEMIFPRNHYTAIDIDDVLLSTQKFKKVKYIKGDAVKGKIPGEYDFVFGGVTNSSQCEIPTIQDMIDHMKSVGECLKPGGIFVVSIFYAQIGQQVGKFSYAYEPVKIEFGKNSSQSWVSHTFSFYITDFYTGRTRFYMLNVILDSKGNFIDALYSDDYTPRDWSYATVAELGSMNGYKFERELSKHETGMLVFRKQ